MANKRKSFPPPLKPGDKVAIVSPAGSVDERQVVKATEVLHEKGWVPVVYPNALGCYGTYSGTYNERLGDIEKALLDPEIKAIICSRGGYGAVHLLESLDRLPLKKNPKWLVGFSDISALHALFVKHGLVSVHGPMTKDIARGGLEDDDILTLFDILEGKIPETTFPSSPYDRPGIASGQLQGGNLAVIADLIGTPFSVAKANVILFIEDLEEPIYKVERILYQLRLAGILPKLKGLLVGQFTGYKPNKNYEKMEVMIHDMVAPYSYPVAMDVPVGHVDHNIPLISGAYVTFRVTNGENNSLVYW